MTKCENPNIFNTIVSPECSLTQGKGIFHRLRSVISLIKFLFTFLFLTRHQSPLPDSRTNMLINLAVLRIDK